MSQQTPTLCFSHYSSLIGGCTQCPELALIGILRDSECVVTACGAPQVRSPYLIEPVGSDLALT